MMLISVLGMSAQKTWNFSDEIWYSGVNDEGKPITTDYTEATTIDGLTLTPASGKKFTVDANSKTVDDVNYIARLKFPGSAAADGGNTVSFDVSGPCTIKIVLQSSNSNEDRTLNLCAGAYDKENPFATMTALGASPSAGTCTYKGEAATIFVGSYSSGINLYAIYVEPLPVYSIVGDFFTTDLLSGWDYDMDMTQSEENENIYTLVVDKFTAEAKTYEYKLRTNHKWGGFEIPEDGTNQNWVFGTDMYPAGDYKLTFTANIADKTLELLPEAIEPELNVVENIAAFKTYETEGEFALKLNNVKVTYAASGVKDYYGTEQPYDWAVLEDASGAYVFQDLGLGAAFSTGMTLNGQLVLNCSSGWFGPEITASDNTAASIAAIQAEAGTAEPIVLTEENLDSYAADYDWRYVKIENMTAKLVAGTYSDDLYLHCDLTDADYGIMDMLGTNVELPADGDVVDMEGYLFIYYGTTYLQPLTLTKKEAVESPIESMAIVGTFPGMTWEPAEGIAMTQDPENDAVWTVTMEGVEVEGQTYEYKATANGTWGVYELPASGNQNFVFGTEEYPAGVYNLTFTANTSEHTLTLVVEPAQASTEFVDIVVTDEVTDGTLFYRTFSCEQPLDFTGVEGIKAYIGKKNILYDYDANVDASEIILTPIEKVPANTGILLKATEAKTYTVGVAVGDVPAVTDNDLLVAAEKTDLFPLIDGYNKGVATLGHEMKEENDWWTGQTVTVDALGFLVLPVPAEEGVDFLEKGDVYLSLTKDDLSQTSYHSDYVKLTFTDAEIPVVEDIASFVALANETDATLKFAENTVVTFAGESVVAIQDNTGGLVFQGIEFPSAFNAGDVLTGEITGKLNKAELYPLLVATVQTDPSTVVVAGTSELNPPVVTFEEAFSDENIMRLVKLENVKVSVVEGSYSPTITFTDSNGTDLVINDLFDAVTADLYNLTDGCTLKELTGIAYLIPDGSFYVNFYDINQFQPISFEVAEEETHEYAIVGDLTGGWDNDMVMTQSEEDPNVYTLTVENFEAFAKTYEYKLRADKQWGIFELPAEGNNSYTFEEMGIYTLTFTANIAENTLTLEAEKTGELVPTYSIVGDFFTDGDISGWDNDQDMTQSDVDENIFTLVVEDFAAAAQTYEYKLRANHQWGLFEIPASGNQNFVFGTEEYPEGTYTLTFTFNAADNTLTLDVESNAPATGIRSMNIDWADGNTYNLNGQRIDTPQKGVVIRNGRKVVIK